MKVPIFRKGSLAFLSESRFVLEIVNQAGLYACVPRESSVPTEPALGHLRCRVTDMPPQPNSPSGRCLETRLATRSPEGPALGAVLATVGSSRCPGFDTRTRTRSSRSHFPASRESGGNHRIIPNQAGPTPGDADKTTGLFTRLVKQRSRWWYFIFAFAATYTTSRMSPHRARLESNSTGSSFPA